jgi:hypothetical protein
MPPISMKHLFTNQLTTHEHNASHGASALTKIKRATATFICVLLTAVTIAQVPTVTSFTPTSICTGAAVTLTGTNFTSATDVRFNGVSAASFTVVSATSITAIPASTATTGTVSVVRATGTGTSATAITLKTLPVISITPATPFICGSTPAALTASAAGAASYAWSPSTGLSATNIANPTANPTASTIYTVTVTGTNACTATRTTTVNIGNAVTAVAPTTSICSGGSGTVALTATETSTAGYSVYSIPYAAVTSGTSTTNYVTNGVLNTPVSGGSSDDGWWSGVTIPFTFNYFGTNYTSFALGTNGVLQFGTNFSTWVPIALPQTTVTNYIAGLWSDQITQVAGANISTYTTGTAPNRVFTTYYNTIPYYNGSPTTATGNTSFTIQIYETSNIIEVHLGQVIGAASTTNSNQVGISDPTGLKGTAAPGRNAQAFSVTTPEAWRFTPINPALKYAWTGSTTGLSATNVANPTISGITAPTPLVVTITDTQTGCNTTVYDTIRISKNDTIRLTSTTTTSQSLCINTAITSITYATSGGATGASVTGLPTGVTGTYSAGVVTISGTPSISGTFNYTVTTSGPCTAATATGTITVNALPTAPTVGTITQPTCGLATASVALSGLPATGTWTVNSVAGGFSSTGSGTTGSIAGLTASTTFTFRVTSAAGCVSVASANAVITAQPITPAAPTIGTITQPTCATATGSVVLSGLPGGGGTWTVTASPTGATLSNTGTSRTFSGLATPNTFTFTVTNSVGCTSVASATAVLTAQPTTPVVTVNSPTICRTTSATLTATGGGTYAWSTGATTAGISPAPTTSTTYRVTVTSSGGCTATASSVVTVITTCLTVSGSIFNDANGNGLVDATDSSLSRGQTIYSVIADTTGTVVSTAAIAANGTFTLANVLPSTAGFTVRVSTTNPAVGATVPTVSWPAGWGSTLAQYGVNNANGTGLYSNTNQIIPVKTGTLNITSILLGYDRLPNTPVVNKTITRPALNGTFALTSLLGFDTLKGTDPEDGVIKVGGKFIIKAVSGLAGNKLYYDANGNGIADAAEVIVADQIITNYAPAKLLIKFSGLGSTGALFTYSAIDAAGKISTSASSYSIGWVGTALPVKLVSYKAEKAGTQSILSWVTASEIDNDHFEIERSTDGTSWHTIGEVKGNGTTTETTHYTFTDSKPTSGSNYYRLKQVDVDGKYEHTAIQVVTFDGLTIAAPTATLYPNPMRAGNTLHIKLTGGNAQIAQITIVNQIGQTLLTQKDISATDTALELSLPAGIYFTNITTDNDQHISQRFVVE